MTNNKRIESSAEITALLKYFMEYLGADAAILYKYIDTDDLEASELLELLARSPLKEGIADIKVGKKTIKELIDAFVQGSINFSTGSDSISLNKLKKEIGVLRFCDFAEREGTPSRWKFDYANRPRKYLVVKSELRKGLKQEEVPDGVKPADKDAYLYQLQDEGVTALFCRSEGDQDRFIGLSSTHKSELGNPDRRYAPHLVLSREDLNNQRSHTKTTKEYGVFDNFHSHHAAFVLLKEITSADKDEIIGCLRFEFYDKGDSFKSEISTIMQKLQDIADLNMVNMVVGVVKKALTNLKDKSYENQYHCLAPILDQVKNVGVLLRNNKFKIDDTIKTKHKLTEEDFKKLQSDLKISGINGINAYKDKYEIEHMQQLLNAMKLIEIQGLIEHLFYVLKRNTYYGEAILERINHFIADLLKALDLPQKIFSEIWDSLKKHEDLMLYDIDNYRDHLMHQFHVFIVGYLFICSYGVEQYKNLMQCSYDKAMKRASLHCHLNRVKLDNDSIDADQIQDNGYLFSNTDIIRIWTLASLFHDCGYAFEKLSAGFDSFSQRVLGAKLETEFKLDKVFFENSIMIGSIETMTCYFACCDTISSNFDRVKLFRILTDLLLRKFDHGVISALILLEKFKEKSDVSQIEDIKYIAALAIAIHNQQVFEKLHEVCNQSICLQSNPVAYLLGYCDTIQEWGRKKTTKDNLQKATPRLKSLKFPSSDNPDKNMKRLTYEVELKYPTSSEGNKPDVENIKRILSKKQCVFITSCDQVFRIKYDIRSCLPEGFTVDFMPCGHRCEFLHGNNNQHDTHHDVDDCGHKVGVSTTKEIDISASVDEKITGKAVTKGKQRKRSPNIKFKK